MARRFAGRCRWAACPGSGFGASGERRRLRLGPLPYGSGSPFRRLRHQPRRSFERAIEGEGFQRALDGAARDPGGGLPAGIGNDATGRLFEVAPPQPGRSTARAFPGRRVAASRIACPASLRKPLRKKLAALEGRADHPILHAEQSEHDEATETALPECRGECACESERGAERPVRRTRAMPGGGSPASRRMPAAATPERSGPPRMCRPSPPRHQPGLRAGLSRGCPAGGPARVLRGISHPRSNHVRRRRDPLRRRLRGSPAGAGLPPRHSRPREREASRWGSGGRPPPREARARSRSAGSGGAERRQEHSRGVRRGSAAAARPSGASQESLREAGGASARGCRPREGAPELAGRGAVRDDGLSRLSDAPSRVPDFIVAKIDDAIEVWFALVYVLKATAFPRAPLAASIASHPGAREMEASTCAPLQQCRDAARAEGVGKSEGKADLPRLLLESELEGEVRDRVPAADERTLEGWAVRAADASSPRSLLCRGAGC